MKNKKIKIALGDLRHSTIGKHSSYVPIGIGYIGSFLLSQFNKNVVDVKFYTDPDYLINDIYSYSPNIIGLSNYCWNSSLSKLIFRIAKGCNSNTLCILGGPDFPKEAGEREEYLLKHPEIDFYIYGDGEEAFFRIVRSSFEADMQSNELKNGSFMGACYIESNNKKIVIGNSIDRFRNMDIIPSPYLTGLMDEFLKGDYIPSLETARGCPFKCGFCFNGYNDIKKIGAFSVGRIKEELSYIAKKVRYYSANNSIVAIHDSNWGISQRDEEILGHLSYLIDKLDWPRSIETSTSKVHLERSIQMGKLLKGRLPINISFQSLNDETLKIIKRDNISKEKYFCFINEIKKQSQSPVCELIIPLPKETKESYFSGVKDLIGSGINIGTYTLMMLKGTLLSTREYRQKYKMKTKFRLLPRQFGVYNNKKCFEIEEVCVETDSMSFQDYVFCRGFCFIVEVFSTIHFEVIRKHLRELRMSYYDFICLIFKTIKLQNTCMSELYRQFINETKLELFDSEEDFYSYFDDKESYKKLLRAELGDNLIRKYLTKFFLLNAVEIFDFVYDIVKIFVRNNMTEDLSKALNDSKKWASVVMTVNSVFNGHSSLDKVDIIELEYDVLNWYRSSDIQKTIFDYKKPVTYKISYNHDYIYGILEECKNLYGTDVEFQCGKFLSTRKVIDLWRNCEEVVKA